MICPLVVALAFSDLKFDRHGDLLPAGTVARIGTVRFYHRGAEHLRYSTEGTLLASASQTHLRLWRVKDGKLLTEYELPGDFHGLGPVAEDGSVIVVCDTTTVRLDRKGNSIKTWNHENLPIPSAVELDGSAPVLLEKRTQLFRAILIPSPDGSKVKRISLEDYDRRVRVFGNVGVTSVTISPNRKFLAFGSAEDQRACVIDIATGKSRLLPRKYRFGPANHHLEFTPDGMLLGTEGDTLWIFDPVTAKEKFARLLDRRLLALAASPDGKTIAIVKAGSLIRFLNHDDLTERPMKSVEQEAIWITSLSWTPDSQHIVTASSDGRVIVWAHDGRFVRELDRVPEDIVMVEVSPNGKQVLAGGIHHHVYSADLEKGHWKGGWDGWFHYPTSPVFSPDGSEFVSLDRTTTICVRSSVDGKELRRIGDPNFASLGVGFSSSGRIAAVAQSEEVWVWDGATGKPIGSRPWFCRRLTFSPDGWWLAGCSQSGNFGGPVEIWEPTAERGRGTFMLGLRDAKYGHHCFTPDGRFMIATDQEGIIHVFQLPDGEEVLHFDGHVNGIITQSVSPDGRWLVAVNAEPTALLWDLRPLHEKEPFNEFELYTAWVSLTSDNPRSVYEAMMRLEHSGNHAVKMIAENFLIDAEKTDQIQSLIKDLASPTFRKRQEAESELLKLGPEAMPLIVNALSQEQPNEVKRRLEQIVRQFPKKLVRSAQDRRSRTIRILQSIDTEEARQLLNKLTQK